MFIHPSVLNLRLSSALYAQKDERVSPAEPDKFALKYCFALEVNAINGSGRVFSFNVISSAKIGINDLVCIQTHHPV